MGLDMYLSAKRYLWRSDGVDKEIAETIGNMEIGSNGLRVKEISCEAMYWRKANAIHHWFVHNVQSGDDDCREYRVAKQTLYQLLEVCEEVQRDPDKALDLLPPYEGFFFGSASTDDWYWDDLKQTVDRLRDLLSSTTDDWEFYYASSW